MGRCENRHRSFLSLSQISIRSSVQIKKDLGILIKNRAFRTVVWLTTALQTQAWHVRGYVTEQHLEGVYTLHGKCLYSFAEPRSEMSPL